MMRIIQGDLSDPRVVDLLRIHLTSARAATAPGSAHALDLSGLQSSDISFWTIWENEILLGIGALKRPHALPDQVEVLRCSQPESSGGSHGDNLHFRIFTKAFDRGANRFESGAAANDGWNGRRVGFRADGGS